MASKRLFFAVVAMAPTVSALLCLASPPPQRMTLLAESEAPLVISYPELTVLPALSQPLTDLSRSASAWVLNNRILNEQESKVFQASLHSSFKDNGTSAADAYQTVNAIATARSLEGAKGKYFAQGFRDANWLTDKYASDMAMNSVLGLFFEENGTGGYTINLSGTSNNSTNKLHNLIAAAVGLAPKNILRTAGHFDASAQLIIIDVYDSQGAAKTYTAVDGGKWQLAKIAFHSLGEFVVQTFHTALHLYSHAVVAAQAASVPLNSILNGVMDYQSAGVTEAMLVEMRELHNLTNNYFSGRCYDCDMPAVYAVNTDIARFYLEADLSEYKCPTGMEYCGGGLFKFLGPIQTFAKAISKAISSELGGYMTCLQRSLSKIGIAKDSTGNKYNAEKILTNFMFFASGFHSLLFSNREYMTPLFSYKTDHFDSFFKSSVSFSLSDPAIFEQVVLADMHSFHKMGIVFGTTNLPDDQAELGDGPFYNLPGSLTKSASTFQQNIAAVRQEIYTHFSPGDEQIGFTPMFFYPKGLSRSGNLCASVYI